MTTAKNAVFIGLELKNCCLVGVGNWLLVGEIKIWLWEVGGSLLGGMSGWWGDSPHLQ